MRFLAQQSVPPEKMLEGWLWFGGLALALLTCFVVLVYARRRIRERGHYAGAVFDLDELRRMRDTGEVTIQEYETLRKRSITEMGLARVRTVDDEAGGTALRVDSESKDD